MAELADALDLGSSGPKNGRGGSSPPPRTEPSFVRKTEKCCHNRPRINYDSSATDTLALPPTRAGPPVRIAPSALAMPSA